MVVSGASNLKYCILSTHICKHKIAEHCDVLLVRFQVIELVVFFDGAPRKLDDFLKLHLECQSP